MLDNGSIGIFQNDFQRNQRAKCRQHGDIAVKLCNWIQQYLKYRSNWSDTNVYSWINTLRPRQNGRHFPDDIFKWIFKNENTWITIKILLEYIPRGPIDNITALV